MVGNASSDPKLLLIDATGSGHPDPGIRIYAIGGPVTAADLLLPQSAAFHVA